VLTIYDEIKYYNVAPMFTAKKSNEESNTALIPGASPSSVLNVPTRREIKHDLVALLANRMLLTKQSFSRAYVLVFVFICVSFTLFIGCAVTRKKNMNWLQRFLLAMRYDNV